MTTAKSAYTKRYIPLLVGGLLAAASLLAACTTSSSSTSALAENQHILSACNAAQPPATWVGIDGTGSSASDAILSARLNALQFIVQHTADCSGYLEVTVFSASGVATTTLFDGSLLQPGATANARLQRVPRRWTAS